MLKRYNRLLVALHVMSDMLSGMAAFLLAYAIRFSSGLIAVTKGQPPFHQYLVIAPFVGLAVPAIYQLQGQYRLRRGRTRVDDFFAVLVGSIVTVLAGVAGTLFFETYYASSAQRIIGAYEVSLYAWILFLGLNVLFTFGSREAVRDLLRRRWRAGIGLKRVLIIGAGDLGRTVVDRLLEHGELGFQVIGFVDDRAAVTDTIGYRGLPVLGTLADVAAIAAHERIDVIYVALPIDEHVKMLGVVEFASRECIDVHVVPDLLQFIALRAKLEDLDGLPIISINDVPLRGLNNVIKRVLDIVVSSIAITFAAIPTLVVAWIVRRSSPGPAFYTQERMGLDGKAFTVYKFRSMPVGAEDASGPIWSPDDDPRVTPVGRWLRLVSRTSMSCRSSGTC